eukprot:16968-Heterococcus_DN1.PRE.1
MSGTPDSKFRVSNTSKFGVIDPASSKVVHVTAKPADAAAPAAAASGGKADHKTRLTKSTGKLVDEAGKGRIGGPFTVTKDPAYLKDRLSVFAAAVERQKERHAAKPRVPITVTLPDGSTREGTSWVTTPMDIAAGISKQMSKTGPLSGAGSSDIAIYVPNSCKLCHCRCDQMLVQIIVAKVKYSSRIEDDEANVSSADGLEQEQSDDVATNGSGVAEETAELWDMLRPLIGDCQLNLLKWEDKEAQTSNYRAAIWRQDVKLCIAVHNCITSKVSQASTTTMLHTSEFDAVFWHSSAHCLGHAMECKYGCHLTHGPPIEQGFFYDCYMGDNVVSDKDFPELDKHVSAQCKQKQTFDRLLLSKEEALEMFKYNPFKTEYITTRIPDGGCTTVYKHYYSNSSICITSLGPHVPYSTMIQAFAATRNSATNWLAKTENDTLQRIYGVSFPDKKELKKWQEFQEQTDAAHSIVHRLPDNCVLVI